MDKTAFGNHIKRARESKQMTQEAFAEMIGYAPDHVSVIERGLQLPRIEKLVDIANALEVSMDYLFEADLVVSSEIHASVLSERIKALPLQKQKTVLAVLDTLIRELENDE